MFLSKHRWLGGLLGTSMAVLSLGACSDDKKSTTAAAASSSGGDDAESASTAMAKQVPKGSKSTPQAGSVDKSGPKAPTLVTVAPVPTLVAVATDDDSAKGPSPWGAPDAESGKPLPKRPKLNKAGLEAYKQGLAALAANNLPAAKQAFERCVAADPKAAFEAEYNLGVIADRQGQPEDALQHYGKSLKLQPDYELAVQGAANVMQRRGNPAATVSYVQPIATRWERNLYLQAILADALVRADRIDEGEQAARKALRRDERFVPAIVSLAKASLRRGRTELAASTLDQALDIDPKYAEIHFLKGKLAQGKGDLAAALVSFRKAVELRPDYAEARMALGMQFMASGNYNEALQQFEVTITLVPTLVQAHVNLADAYRALKRWQDAKKEFDKALRMQAELPEAHFDLALMYMSAGATFPGLTELDALDRALLEFNTYRTQMGPKLTSTDPSATYMADVQRRQEREKKRIEREKAAAEKAAARKARDAAEKKK